MDIIHITHNDLDAVGCAFLIEKVFGRAVVYHRFCSNYHVDSLINDILTNLENPDETSFYITDISCSEETYKRIKEETGHAPIMFDHHPTNPFIGKDINGAIVPEATTDYEQIFDSYGHPILISATMLLYDYIMKSPTLFFEDEEHLFIKELVTAISLYDTWEWTNYPVIPNRYHISSLATAVKMMRPENVLLELLRCKSAWDYQNNIISTFVSVIDRIQDNAMERILSNYKIYKEEDGTYVGYYICDSSANMSLLHEAIFNFSSTPMYDYQNILSKVAYTKILYPTSSQISLRTKRKDIDLSEIAKSYGGGGHKAAAGAKLSSFSMMKELEKYYSANSLYQIKEYGEV